MSRSCPPRPAGGGGKGVDLHKYGLVSSSPQNLPTFSWPVVWLRLSGGGGEQQVLPPPPQKTIHPAIVSALAPVSKYCLRTSRIWTFFFGGGGRGKAREKKTALKKTLHTETVQFGTQMCDENAANEVVTTGNLDGSGYDTGLPLSRQAKTCTKTTAERRNGLHILLAATQRAHACINTFSFFSVPRTTIFSSRKNETRGVHAHSMQCNSRRVDGSFSDN